MARGSSHDGGRKEEYKYMTNVSPGGAGSAPPPSHGLGPGTQFDAVITSFHTHGAFKPSLKIC